MRVCVIGTGYAGLTTAACLSFIGHSVIAVDKDGQRIDMLKAGAMPFHEPGLRSLVASGVKAGRLVFSQAVEQGVRAADVMLVAVSTPGLPDGRVDLTSVEQVAQAIGESLAIGADDRLRVVAWRSTMPVGSTMRVERIIRESYVGRCRSLSASGTGDHCTGQRTSGGQFLVASNPEFLREGSTISDWLYPDRIVIGATDERAIRMLTELYRPILEQSFPAADCIPRRPSGVSQVPLEVTDPHSAEMAKYAANAFLALKISFANEIAAICESVGANIIEVMRVVGLDRRIGSQYLGAGIGWGGSCLGKDTSALIRTAEDFGYEPSVLRSSLITNQKQGEAVVQKLTGIMGGVEGKTIGLLGLTFKPNTDDIREAPSLTLAQALLKRGAQVKVYDPAAMKRCQAEYPHLALTYASDGIELATGCHALVLVTEWDEFQQLDLVAVRQAMAGNVLVDGRNALDPGRVRDAGLKYIGIGR